MVSLPPAWSRRRSRWRGPAALPLGPCGPVREVSVIFGSVGLETAAAWQRTTNGH